MNATATEIKELVGQVVDRVKATGEPASLAAEHLYNGRITPDARYELGRIGLVRLANDALHTIRVTPSRDSGSVEANQAAGEHPRQWREDVYQAITLQGADAEIKPLADCSATDLDHYVMIARSMESAWSARAQVVTKLAAELRKQRKGSVSLLSQRTLDSYADEVEKAWRA